MKNNTIELSPYSRLRVTFNTALDHDSNGVFGWDTYENYLEMQQKSEMKMNQILRSLIIVNVVLFFVMNGNDWSIPVIDVKISSIPVILEILLFFSAVSFFYFCAAFITNQCYGLIIEQYGIRIVNNDLIDPEYFTASRKKYEFFLKIFREKSNIFGEDYLRCGLSFSILSKLIYTIILMPVLIFPSIHLLLAIVASHSVVNADWGIWWKVILLATVALINLGGLAMLFTHLKSFTFTMIQFEPEAEDSGQAASDLAD